MGVKETIESGLWTTGGQKDAIITQLQ
jgi:hypothetical protein